jgi:hypothetical protein
MHTIVNIARLASRRTLHQVLIDHRLLVSPTEFRDHIRQSTLNIIVHYPYPILV